MCLDRKNPATESKPATKGSLSDFQSAPEMGIAGLLSLAIFRVAKPVLLALFPERRLEAASPYIFYTAQRSPHVDLLI